MSTRRSLLFVVVIYVSVIRLIKFGARSCCSAQHNAVITCCFQRRNSQVEQMTAWHTMATKIYVLIVSNFNNEERVCVSTVSSIVTRRLQYTCRVERSQSWFSQLLNVSALSNRIDGPWPICLICMRLIFFITVARLPFIVVNMASSQVVSKPDRNYDLTPTKPNQTGSSEPQA